MIELNQSEWNVCTVLLQRASDPLAPSMAELACLCGLRSARHIKKVIDTLEDCGLLLRGSRGQARTYRAVRAPVALRPGIRRRPRAVADGHGEGVRV